MSEFKISTISLLPQVTKKVSFPVVAAGGIVDGIDAKATLDMVSEAIYMRHDSLLLQKIPRVLVLKKLF